MYFSETNIISESSAMEEFTFEDAFSQLEKTVKALEAGNNTLEASSRLFEEGIRLAKICHDHLSTTEIRITQLQGSFEEQMALNSEDKRNAQG
jgi:exodeoxyribonuclease VII small subunit